MRAHVHGGTSHLSDAHPKEGDLALSVGGETVDRYSITGTKSAPRAEKRTAFPQKQAIIFGLWNPKTLVNLATKISVFRTFPCNL